MRILIKYLALIINILFLILYIGGCLAIYAAPNQFNGLVFFGTIFPVLLVINICFMVFWLFTRKWVYAALLVLVFIASFSCVRGVFFLPFQSAKADDSSRTLSLLTYNISNFGGFRQIDPICNYITKQDPDLVCLQEFAIRFKNNQKDVDGILDRLGRRYPYRMLWYKNQQGPRWWGVAIFSKFPLVNKQKVDYQSLYNVSIQADMIYYDDTIRIFNNHLESNKLTMQDMKQFRELHDGFKSSELLSITELLDQKLSAASSIRAAQARVVRHNIENSPYPVVVCGDFNDVPQSYVYHHIKGQLNDVVCQSAQFGYTYTFHHHYMFVRIDHVLADPSFIPLDARIDKLPYSDHYPIVSHIAIPIKKKI